MFADLFRVEAAQPFVLERACRHFFLAEFFLAIAAPAARAAMDRISHGVDFDTTPIETALNWGTNS